MFIQGDKISRNSSRRYNKIYNEPSKISPHKKPLLLKPIDAKLKDNKIYNEPLKISPHKKPLVKTYRCKAKRQ